VNKKVIIIGAGGHGKVIADIVLSSGDRVLGFLDDCAKETGLPEIPVLGAVRSYFQYPEAEFVIAIGNATVRQKIAEKMHGVIWYTAIHPRAVVSPLGVTIGEGSVVMANAVINPGTTIGRHCIVNTAASIDHDNYICDFAHVSVGARLAGTVRVGERTWVGIGAIISNNISVCSDCLLGAGSVVVKDVVEAGTYAGVPVRRIK